jgi:hypothetical protein
LIGQLEKLTSCRNKSKHGIHRFWRLEPITLS